MVENGRNWGKLAFTPLFLWGKTRRITEYQERETMTPQEIGRLQTYLREMFNMPQIRVKPRQGTDDSAEVLIGEEFIATLYRDEDEGEISYAFTMSILEMDLP